MARFGARLVANGYAILPIQPGTKKPGCHRGGGMGILVFDHHRKFVTAQAGHRVDRTDAVLQAPRDLLQQQVAHVMALGVVDAFEVVQVQQDQGQR